MAHILEVTWETSDSRHRLEGHCLRGFRPVIISFIPHRYEDAGIVSCGYDEQVMGFSEVDVPMDFPEGEYEVKANVRWLVCKPSALGTLNCRHR